MNTYIIDLDLEEREAPQGKREHKIRPAKPGKPATIEWYISGNFYKAFPLSVDNWKVSLQWLRPTVLNALLSLQARIDRGDAPRECIREYLRSVNASRFNSFLSRNCRTWSDFYEPLNVVPSVNELTPREAYTRAHIKGELYLGAYGAKRIDLLKYLIKCAREEERANID